MFSHGQGTPAGWQDETTHTPPASLTHTPRITPRPACSHSPHHSHSLLHSHSPTRSTPRLTNTPRLTHTPCFTCTIRQKDRPASSSHECLMHSTRPQAHRCRAERGQLQWIEGPLPEITRQNLALTVLYVPHSLDSVSHITRTPRHSVECLKDLIEGDNSRPFLSVS